MQQIYSLFTDFPDDSRVWLYNSDRAISEVEAEFVQENLENFASQWKAHSTPLRAKACMLNEYTLAFVVDQTEASVSGCSVDTSVRFVKDLGKELGINFFNRMNIVYENEKGVRSLASYKNRENLGEGHFYNPLITTLEELKNNWVVKLP
jgi:hypothetical protein